MHKLLACPRQETDKAENLLVKHYFTHEGLTPVVDLQNQTTDKDFVASAQNPSRAVIWEVHSQWVQGARTVAERTEPDLLQPLVRFLGDNTHFSASAYPCISKTMS